MAEVVIAAVQHVGRANIPHKCNLFLRPHHIDQPHTVARADPLQHLTEAGCRCGVDDRRMTLCACGLYEPQRRHRVDGQCRALCGCDPVWQRQSVACSDLAQVSVHAAADQSHPATEPVLTVRACCHNGPRALIAHSQRFSDADREPRSTRLWNIEHQFRAVGLIRDAH